MKCEDIRKYIPIFIDGEFAERENIEIESHLHECEECKKIFQFETYIKKLLMIHLSSIHAPKNLKENIQNHINQIKTPETKQYLFYFGIPAVATILALIIYISFPKWTDNFAETLVTSHEENIGNQIFGSYSEVETFLKAKAPFPVNIPIKDDADTKLIGARIVQYKEQPAIILMYKYKDKNLSLIGYPDNGETIKGRNQLYLTPKSRYVTVDHARGYSVATFNEKGMNHSLIGDIGETELLGLIPATY